MNSRLDSSPSSPEEEAQSSSEEISALAHSAIAQEKATVVVAAAESKVAKLVQAQRNCRAQASAAAEASAHLFDLIEYMEQAVEEVNGDDGIKRYSVPSLFVQIRYLGRSFQ